MPTFRFLTSDDEPQLYRCFTTVFQHYYVSMAFSQHAFARRLQRMGVSIGWSAGVFEGEQMLGFILTGIGKYDAKNTAYNAGTGMLPEARRRRLTIRLYRWLIRELQDGLGVEQFLLEVVEKNRPALRLYEALGFRVSRYLCSYQIRRRSLSRPRQRERMRVVGRLPDWAHYLPLRCFEPYWGNDFPALERGFGLRDYCLEYLDENQRLAGFLQGEVSTGKIALWGSPSDTRVAKELFSMFAWLSPAKTLSVLNVPARSEDVRRYLKEWGGKNFLNQYEMRLLV